MRKTPAFVWLMLMLAAFEGGWLLLGGVKSPVTGEDPLAGLFGWLIAVELTLAALWLFVGMLNRYPDDLGDGAVVWTLLGVLPVWTLRTESSPGVETIRRGVGRGALQRALTLVADEVRPLGRSDWLLLSREKMQIESYHEMAVLQALIHDLKNAALEHGVALDELEDRFAGAAHDEALLDLLTRVRASADDIAERMVELSSLARLHKLYIEEVDPRELTDEVLHRLDNLPAAAGLRFDVEDEIPALRLDRTLMRMALDNLVRNALQACPADGAVSILLHTDGDWLEWRVVNPGALDEEALRRIEKPGWSTRPGGAGLGAPVARKIIQRHGGVLRYDSGADRVTTTIRLPLKD